MGRDLKIALKQTFGFSSFRPNQKEIIEASLSGRDLFAALPTGGGKSLCYQLPSLLLPKLTVVVSPLIALMEDQVAAAHETGIAAAYINSSLSTGAARETYRLVHTGSVQLLCVSPERIALPSFRESLHRWGVSLFAIDEAHCISEWGHEFRPEYRNLTVLRKEFPETPIAAFTATATPRVQEDVITALELNDPYIVRGDFDRREIFYRVRRKTDVLQQIEKFVGDHPNEPGIVYRGTRKAVEETAQRLSSRGYSALPYHAGLSDDIRRSNQRAFVSDDIQVIVATIAFGMGIDKSNVRWVVHGDLPRSVEAYYQETGRAGRDGEDADTCLFYGPGDISKIRYHIDRMEVETERTQAEENLREVLRFVEAGACRRTQLLRHFGQDAPERCDRCDVCTGEITRVDHTVEAQKAMSAILRTGERFGGHYVADILVGTSSERIERFGHHRLPTFGVGSDRSKKWWLALIGDLEAAALIQRTGGKQSGLSVTHNGRDVLFGREPFFTVRREDVIPGRTALRVVWRDDQEALFQCLRALRRRLAKETGIPPYMVFSDKTLKTIVRNRPDSLHALLRVHGVGERKVDRYGAAVIETVGSFLQTGECREHVK